MPQIKSSDSIKTNSLFDGIKKNFSFNINQKDFVEKKEGDVIYQSGEPADYVYLILEGEVKIKIPGVFKSPVIIKNGKNEFFGEQEYLENIKRNTSAVANTDCVLYRLDKETLNVLIYNNKRIKGNLNKFSGDEESEQNDILNYPEVSDEDINEIPHDEPKPMKINIDETFSEEINNFRLEEAEKDLKKVEEYLDDNEQDLKWDFNSEPQQEEVKNTDTNYFTTPEDTAEVKTEINLANEPIPSEIINTDSVESLHKAFSKDKLESLKAFTSFINSSIKYPLSTLKFYAEQIKKRDAQEDITEVVDLLIEQTDIISDVIQTTKEFAKGNISLNPQKVSISALLDEILVMLADYIESSNSKLYKKYETTALVSLDKQKFLQAVFQIVKNACESMPGGGSIYFITKTEPGFVRIEISNTGENIPEDLHDKIFEPFFSSRKEGTAGIGLSIAEKIIKNHGGDISINPKSDRTSFIIIIPIAE